MEKFRKLFEAREVKIGDIYIKPIRFGKKPKVKVLSVSPKMAHVKVVTPNSPQEEKDIPIKILQNEWELDSYIK